MAKHCPKQQFVSIPNRVIDNMEAYCLFCNTVKCESIAAELNRRFHYEAYSPKIIQRKWVKGKCFEETRDYLPGYVFLYSDCSIKELAQIRSVDGVLRLLGEKEDGYRLFGDDLKFADMILQKRGTIGVLKAVEVGDRVRINKESLAGADGEIKKIDRHKGRAKVQFTFDQRSFQIWVGIDIVDKQ